MEKGEGGARPPEAWPEEPSEQNKVEPSFKDKREQAVLSEKRAVEESLETFLKSERVRELLRLAAARGFDYIPLDATDLTRVKAGETDLLTILVNQPEEWLPRMDAIALQQLQVEDQVYADQVGSRFHVMLFNLPETTPASEIGIEHLGKLIQTRVRLDQPWKDFGVVIEETREGKVQVERWVHQPLPSKRLIIEFRNQLATGTRARGSEVEVVAIVKTHRKKLTLHVVSERSFIDRFFQALKPPEEESIVEQRRPLRNTIKFFYMEPIYVGKETTIDRGGDLLKRKTKWKLWWASQEPGDTGVLIFDKDSFVNERRLEYALRVIDQDDLSDLSQELPVHVRKRIQVLFGTLSLEELWASGRILTPVARLRDPSILTTIDWRKEVVENIINFRGAVKHEPLKTVRRATLLRGIRQETNAHSIIVLPGQTGKSEFYRAIGILEDRATSRSLIGYADTSGPHPGSLHGCDLPFAIDQLEEAETWQILRYILGLMECGRARVDTAAHPYDIYSLSPIIFLANPLGSPTKDFTLLLLHLSRNPASGRRFGVILYDFDREGYKVPRIERREKDLGKLLSEKIQLFRAVEEYCRPRIEEIVSQSWDWLNRRNLRWIESAVEAIGTLKEDADTRNLYDFLAEFIYNGNTHMRGAALNIAIVDNLDKIALNDISLDELLNAAEDALHDILEINYNSLVNIAESYEQVREKEIIRMFDTFPTYLKEIISAVEWLRRKRELQVPLKVSLRSLPYTPDSKPYFSKVLDDAKKSNPAKYREKLKAFFGFELTKDLEAVIYRAKPTEGIEPLGRFGDFRSFGDFEDLEEEAKTLGTGEEAGGEYKPSSEEMHGRRDSTPLLERSKIPKIRKTPKRLVCRRCLEELKEAGDLLEVCGKAETSMDSCEVCGERPGAFWVRIKWDEGGGGGE